MRFIIMLAHSMLVLCFVFGTYNTVSAATHTPVEEPRIKVMLERTYLDGEVSEEVFTENVSSLETFFKKYDDWQLVDRNDEQVVLQKRIQDISPLLKINGYFGVSKEGILQTFEGVPRKENAIHSFFQIDMKKLKSYKRNQLKRGIRIESKERFVKVIEEMKQYTVQKK